MFWGLGEAGWGVMRENSRNLKKNHVLFSNIKSVGIYFQINLQFLTKVA